MNNNNQELPPKTCTIDRLVTVKEDITKVIQGLKTASRRNARYADIGEIMELDNIKFVVERVFQQTLGEMTDEHAKQEGYADLEAYKQSVLSLHPGMPWVSSMKVWVHEYNRVKE